MYEEIKVDPYIYKDLYKFLKRAYMKYLGSTTVRVSWGVQHNLTTKQLSDQVIELLLKWKHPDLIRASLDNPTVPIEVAKKLFICLLEDNRDNKEVALKISPYHYTKQELEELFKRDNTHIYTYNREWREYIIKTLNITTDNIKEYPAIQRELSARASDDKLRLEACYNLIIRKQLVYIPTYLEKDLLMMLAERLPPEEAAQLLIPLFQYVSDFMKLVKDISCAPKISKILGYYLTQKLELRKYGLKITEAEEVVTNG